MTLAMLVPGALGALLAVLVPLAIHIARRTETQVVDFAALRWLAPNPKPVRRPRLEERLLLAARILLVIAIVLSLAEPVLRPQGDRRPVVAVSPDVNPSSVPDRGERRVWLAPGFPSLEHPAPKVGNVPSLIRQLDVETPGQTPIAIVVPPQLSGDGERLYLSRQVDWRVGRSVERPGSNPASAPPRLTVRYAPGSEAAVGYFRAAAAAMAPPGAAPLFEAAPADAALSPGSRYLVWLSPAPMPAATLDWIEAGGVALLAQDAPSPVEGVQPVVWRDAEGAPLAVGGRFGKGRVLRLTRPAEPNALPALVEPSFPETLWTVLAPPPTPDRVAAADYAPSVRATPAGGTYSPHPIRLRPWLAVLAALVFVAERWLATRRSRT